MALFNCEILDLRAFLTLYETRSFQRTAKLLNLSQPAISRRIQKLEEAAGGPLFDRSTRTLADTALCKELLPVARRMLDDVDSSLFSAPDLSQRRLTTITIACIPTAAFYFLPRVIQRSFDDRAHVRIRILDVPAVEGMELVARREAEFGISILSNSEPELSFEPLHDDPLVLACRRDHPLAGRTVVDWRELNDFALIAVARSSRNRTLLDVELAKAGIVLGWRYEVAHLTTSLGLVEAGVGIAVVPRMALPSEDHPTLTWRRLGAPDISRTIGIVMRDDYPLAPAAETLLNQLRATWR